MKTRSSIVNTSMQSPSSPAAGSKRSPGPTRILPKRSCSDNSINKSSNSILTKPQNNPTDLKRESPVPKQQQATTTNVKALLVKPKQTLSSIDEISESLLNSIKTANSKNYSRDSPLTRSSTNIKSIKQTNKDANSNPKPVRISLPENASLPSTSNKSIIQSKLGTPDKNRYMFTVNGLKKINNSSANNMKNASENGAASTSSSEGELDNAVERVSNSCIDIQQKNFKLLIGVTGSVAAIKLLELIKKIKSKFPRPYTSKSTGSTIEAYIQIKIVMTKNSKHFVPKEDLMKDLNDPNIQVYDDDDEWSQWKAMNDPVVHIELRKWADMCLIAPLDANSMAKLTNGICDNLLTCVVRAWDVSKPLIYCPAMNVHMYHHPLTREHLCKLQSFGYLRVDSVEKRLACGDFGMGGMAPVETIVDKVIDNLFEPVAKKLSLSKSLLNQQPTYPIITTPEVLHGAKQGQSQYQSHLSNQILNRFKTNNQITIHAVSNSNRDNNSSYHDPKRRKIFRAEGLDEEQVNSDRGINSLNIRNTSISKPRHKMGGVTSVQNLKAIAMEDGSIDCADEPTFPDLSSNGSIVDDIGFDLDPTNLLEQTMITDEPIILDSEIRHNSGNSFERNNSSLSNESIANLGGLTPLFNTSKFLALCHNKERGCFTCTICKHDYKNRKSMARHLKEQHVQGNIYQCKPCGVSYKRREKLIKHNRERHQEIS